MRITTPAWVLRRIRWSDTSLILHLYSLDHGRISAMARGALRPGGRLHGMLELFSGISATLSRREGREMDTLIEAAVEEPMPALRSDPRAYAHAGLFSEWVSGLLYGSEPCSTTFHLIGAVFGRLASARSPWSVTCAGIEKLLLLAGVRMELEKCTRCGRETTGEEPAWSHSSGGLVCRACLRPGDAGIAPGLLEFLRLCRRTDIGSTGGTRLWKGGFRQCHDFLREYAEAHVQARLRFRSLAVLEDLENAVR